MRLELAFQIANTGAYTVQIGVSGIAGHITGNRTYVGYRQYVYVENITKKQQTLAQITE